MNPEELVSKRQQTRLRKFGTAGLGVMDTGWLLLVLGALLAAREAKAQPTRYFVDCNQTTEGDGSLSHPWNHLDALSARSFQPGEVAALKRGTVCHGALSLQGSGNSAAIVRLTAYADGPRPKIVAGSKDRQAVLLKNAEYWQIDSLDISGGRSYGLLVTGDQDKTQSHITLRNLVVHEVQGGEVPDKDNGLVVFLRGSKGQRFDHVLIENVVAAHTNQWAGIMMGAGKFDSGEDGYNRDVVIRNSVAHDVFGDGIILFRVRKGLIDASTAWLTGQQPTQNVGTPNAIWTWSCADCTVRNNEAFLTESPGVDGGAYDIDWATTMNTVERNYAHDTQGYCMAVFGAGYLTHDAVLRGNVCVGNGLSPRMAALQGAIYIRTWNGGKIDGLTIEKNFIAWNPPVPAAPIVNDRDTELEGSPMIVRDNTVRSTSPLLVSSFGQKLIFAGNRYDYCGVRNPSWDWNGAGWSSLAELQAAGSEKGSTLRTRPEQCVEETPEAAAYPKFDMSRLEHLTALDGSSVPATEKPRYELIVSLDLALDADGLLVPDAMARLQVLRTLAREYEVRQLQIVVFAPGANWNSELRNALLDVDAPSIRFVRGRDLKMPTRLIEATGRVTAQWPQTSDEFNAATVGYAVRRALGVPIYAQMDTRP